ncbi:DUF645 family protein [Vibrio cholerae]|nr:DUF645 family protein [Vibrio cholerae]EKF9251949.1 DUF645 family protein [Vibrio cholerae]
MRIFLIVIWSNVLKVQWFLWQPTSQLLALDVCLYDAFA